MYQPERKSSMSRMFTVPVTVEFEDVDSYKIAHHTKLVAYCERARIRFLSKLGLELYPDKMNIVLYSLNMRFKRPAQLMDTLDVSVFIESLDDYRLTLGYKIRRQSLLVATASTGIAFMDVETGMLVPAPEKYVNGLRRFMDENE